MSEQLKDSFKVGELMIKRKPCIEQHDEKDCGPAALATISWYYGKQVSLAQVRDATNTDADGTNLYGLIKGANSLGFEGEALSGSFEEMLDAVNNGEVTLPCIAHILTEEFFQHFIVIYSIGKSHVFIADPAKGKKRIHRDSLKNQWMGHIVALKPSSTFEQGKQSPSLLAFFRELVSQQKLLALSILIFTIAMSLVGIAAAFVFRIIIDDILGVADISNLDALVSRLSLICLAVASLYLFDAILKVIRGHALARFSKRLDVAIVLRSYNHTLDLPFEFFGTRKTGEIISRFSDAQAIREMLSSATFSVVVDGFMVVFGATILWLISPLLTEVAFIVAAFYLAVVMLYKKRIRIINQLTMESSAQTTAYFKESVDGIETIKALNMEEEAKGKTSKLFDRLISAVFKQSIMYTNLGAIIGIATSLATLLILWLGVQEILLDKLTLGDLITFNALLGYFLTPLSNLINLQPQLQSVGVAVNRLNDILLAKKEDLESGLMGDSLKGDIVCNDLSFRYGNRDLVLKGISFFVKRGQKVAIVGESGSGKTTLMKILLRFYEPETGNISVNGIQLDSFNKSFLRKRISYLTQNTFLFSDTIKNNILYGCKEKPVSDDEFKHICKICKVDDFVEMLPFGYETRLEENGMNLSGGQRQRIALARALLRKPDVLVLDEAMSNLDSITERALSNMISSFDNVTCIIIAHRLSTVIQCDKILVMDQGHIIESGTHENLMLQRGKYSSFWKSYEE